MSEALELKNWFDGAAGVSSDTGTIDVVVVGQTSTLEATTTLGASISGVGTDQLVISGTSAAVSAVLGSLNVSEPGTGAAWINVEASDTSGQIGDYIGVLAGSPTLMAQDATIETPTGTSTTITLQGIGDQIQLDGTSDTLNLQAGSYAVTASQATIVTQAGTVTQLTLGGSNDQITLNGLADRLSLLAGSGDTIEATSATIITTPGVATGYTLTGNDDTAEIQSAGTYTFATNQSTIIDTDPGTSTLNVSGWDNTIELQGGAVYSVAAYDAKVVTQAGTTTKVNLCGNDNQIKLNGNDDYVGMLWGSGNVVDACNATIGVFQGAPVSFTLTGTNDVVNGTVIADATNEIFIFNAGSYTFANSGVQISDTGTAGNTIVLSGSGDTIALGGTADTLNLLIGGSNTVTANATSTIDAAANTSLDLYGSTTNITLGSGANLMLQGGDVDSISATGATITADANGIAQFNVNGSGNQITLGSGDFLGLVGGSSNETIIASNATISTLAGGSVSFTLTGTNDVVNGTSVAASNHEVFGPPAGNLPSGTTDVPAAPPATPAIWFDGAEYAALPNDPSEDPLTELLGLLKSGDFGATGGTVIHITSGDLSSAFYGNQYYHASDYAYYQNILSQIAQYVVAHPNIKIAVEADYVCDWNEQWISAVQVAGLPIYSVEDDQEDYLGGLLTGQPDTNGDYTSVSSPNLQYATTLPPATTAAVTNLVDSMEPDLAQIVSAFPHVQIGVWNAIMQGSQSIYDQLSQNYVTQLQQVVNGLEGPAAAPVFVMEDVAWTPDSNDTSWIVWHNQFSTAMQAIGTPQVEVLQPNASLPMIQENSYQEARIAQLASDPSISLSAIDFEEFDYGLPGSVQDGPLDNPTSASNLVAEASAIYPLYQAGDISFTGSLSMTGVPQAIAVTNTRVNEAVSLTEVPGSTGNIAVVVLDQTGSLGATPVVGASISGAGTEKLVIDGTAAAVSAVLGSLNVTEPGTGADWIDVETFGTAGQISDYIGVLAGSPTLMAQDATIATPTGTSTTLTLQGIADQVLLDGTSDTLNLQGGTYDVTASHATIVTQSGTVTQFTLGGSNDQITLDGVADSLSLLGGSGDTIQATGATIVANPGSLTGCTLTGIDDTVELQSAGTYTIATNQGTIIDSNPVTSLNVTGSGNTVELQGGSIYGVAAFDATVVTKAATTTQVNLCGNNNLVQLDGNADYLGMLWGSGNVVDASNAAIGIYPGGPISFTLTGTNDVVNGTTVADANNELFVFNSGSYAAAISSVQISDAGTVGNTIALSGNSDTVTLGGTDDTLNLVIGGGNTVIADATSTIDAAANTSLDLYGTTTNITLGNSADLTLHGGGVDRIIATGATINANTGSITEFSVNGSNNNITLGSGDYVGLMGGNNETIIASNATIGTTLGVSVNFTLTGTNDVVNGTTVAAANNETFGPQAHGTSAPVPTIGGLAQASDSGVAGDHITNVTQPEITGTAAPGDTVVISSNNVLAGTVTATAAGLWTYAFAGALENGTYILQATATDPVIDATATSSDYTLQIDTTAPAAPVIAAVNAAVSNGGTSVVSDTDPTITGTGPATDLITVFDNGVVLATTTAAANGTWSLRPATALTSSNNTLIAKATDVAGNVSAQSVPLNVSVAGLQTLAINLPSSLIKAATPSLQQTLGSGWSTGNPIDVTTYAPGNIAPNAAPGTILALSVGNANNNQLVTAPEGTNIVSDTADGAVTLAGGGNSQLFLAASNSTTTFVSNGGSGVYFANQAAGANTDGDNLVYITNGTSGTSGNYLVDTSSGANVIQALVGNDTIAAGTGTDTVSLGSGNDVVEATGTDFISCDTVSGGSDTVNAGGDPNSVTVWANQSDLTFLGGSGQAVIVGGALPMDVVGWAGSDTVWGSSGGGQYWGGQAGNSYLEAGAGAGACTLAGGNGDNNAMFAANAANDVLAAGGGNETLGGADATGNNQFFSGSGNTVILAGHGNDTVSMDAGSSTVWAGTNTLTLADATGFVVASSGQQTIMGGGPSEIYLFRSDLGGGDTIIDNFNPSQDQIAFWNYSASDVNAALAGQTTSGGNTFVTLSDNTRIAFMGVQHLASSSVSIS